MRRPCLRVWTIAATVISGVAPGLAGADAPPGGMNKPGDPGFYEGLREVINRGAELYNHGDPNSCYRLFQGALLVLRVHFADNTDTVRMIDSGILDAERRSYAHERAQTLRRTLDSVLALAGPNRRKDGRAGVARNGPAFTLWERLGGEANVRKVVDDFVAIAGADPRVDFTRGGRVRLDEAKVAFLKKELVDFFSQATGGPIPYTGRTMKAIHQGMAISGAQFDASLGDLRKALEKNGAGRADIDAVLKALEGTRKDLVEAPLSPPPSGK